MALAVDAPERELRWQEITSLRGPRHSSCLGQRDRAGKMLGPRAATRAVMRKLRADWSFGFNRATDPACCATLLPRPRHLSRAPFHGPDKMKSIAAFQGMRSEHSNIVLANFSPSTFATDVQMFGSEAGTAGKPRRIVRICSRAVKGPCAWLDGPRLAGYRIAQAGPPPAAA